MFTAAPHLTAQSLTQFARRVRMDILEYQPRGPLMVRTALATRPHATSQTMCLYMPIWWALIRPPARFLARTRVPHTTQPLDNSIRRVRVATHASWHATPAMLPGEPTTTQQ